MFMTQEERKAYMKKYRAEHKEHIKAARERRNMRLFNDALDHFEKVGNKTIAIMKDGRSFEFIRPY